MTIEQYSWRRDARQPFVEFTTFDGANHFAAWAASPWGFNRGHGGEQYSVQIQRSEAPSTGFKVQLPYPMSRSMACDFIRNRCLEGFSQADPDADILAVLEPRFAEEMRSPAMAWTDSQSGLTWDLARPFVHINPHKQFPLSRAAIVMNAMCYGGYNDWRLPTVAEICTLGKDRYLHLGLFSGEVLSDYRQWMIDKGSSKRPRASMNFERFNLWSSELFGGDCDDHVGVNLHDLCTFWQSYSEDDKRYTYWAETVMVRGCCSG